MESIEIIREELRKNRAKREDLELNILKLKDAIANSQKRLTIMENDLILTQGIISSLEFVKNVPNDLYNKLKITASTNRRSINNEVIFCIENMIKSRKIDADDFINQIDNFYKNIDVPLLTNDKLKKYKENGRL